MRHLVLFRAEPRVRSVGDQVVEQHHSFDCSSECRALTEAHVSLPNDVVQLRAVHVEDTGLVVTARIGCRIALGDELLEEVGTDKAEIIAEMDDWVTYDLPKHLVGVAFHGKYRGQRQKWFALRFTGQDGDIDLTAHEPEFSDFQWVSLEALPGLIVPFKRQTYKAVIAAFQNLA